uniref:Uncharacterized protein n=1 Tax=Anguilla anguilla TaxID=7936 RepID=A0A0E9XWY9_ANGAN
MLLIYKCLAPLTQLLLSDFPSSLSVNCLRT